MSKEVPPKNKTLKRKFHDHEKSHERKYYKDGIELDFEPLRPGQNTNYPTWKR